ncbi:MAG: hypothetical protein GY803_12795 [Chloroflexi bacterium]|nr:hypothetical protein [Chloroflexota bacterium]
MIGRQLRLSNQAIVLLLAFLTLLLSACSTSTAREWLKAPGWSHGLPVEVARIGDPVPMALDDDGNIYLFMITAVNENPQPTVIALNREAEIIWKRTLAISLNQPDKPAILWDGQALNLFWLSEQALYTGQMDTTGDVMGPLRAISGGKIVDSYNAALNPDGSMTVWYAGQRREPGLYVLEGGLTGTAVLVDSEGVRPTLQYDEAGTLHAVWAHYPPGFEDTFFFYANYPDGAYKEGRETAVYQPFLSTTDILTGPQLGLDEETVYLLWNISVRTGQEAGKILTEYIYFPQNRPTDASGRQTIFVPRVSDLDYTHEPEMGLVAGSRVFPVTGQYPRTAAVSDVGTSPSAPELALAFNAQVQHEYRKTRGQVSVLFLQDGQPSGYQLLSFTPQASVKPAIMSDETGHLYLTWLERGDDGGFQVFFTSTAPDIQKALAAPTWGDVVRIARETVFGLLSGAALAPIVVFLWMIAPLFTLLVTQFLRRKEEDKLTGTGTIISLLLAGAAYWASKLATIPGISSFVPFSFWIPAIPRWLQAPLQIGVPLLITIVAIRTAWHFTYRRQSTSLLYFVALFAAIDGLLTMAIYGSLFYHVI